MVDFIALNNTFEVVDAECGGFDVGNSTDDVFGEIFTAQHVARMECGLNIANNCELFKLVDGVFEIRSMFLQDVRTKGVIGLNLDLVSFGTNEIGETVTHVTSASFGKGKTKNIFGINISLLEDVGDPDG